jgi:DNA polymerase-1
VPVERAAPYAAADAAITYRLVAPTRTELELNGLWPLFSDIEMPLVPIIADLDMTGALLDLPYLQTLSQEFSARLDEIKARIFESVGQSFNIGSPKQLNEIFFDKLGLPTNKLRRSAHGFSVDAEALDMLRDTHPAVGLILDWRGLEKLKSTYVDAFPRMVDPAGRIHTSYNQTGAVTGRISSDTPNLQNIPIRTEEGRRVRKAFIAPPGHRLLGVDYSQIELRILAHYSQDEALVDAFRQDQDIHRATAALVFGIPFENVAKEQRYLAKRINFGLMYGMGPQRLARESGLSRSEAETFVQRYFARLPGVRAYLDRSRDLAREQGYLETLKGRRKSFARLADPLLGGGDRARLEREAINMPIQGTAADIIKIAMIRLSRRLADEKCRARLILQVHDELVLEVPDEEVADTAIRVREEMENALELIVPLRAEANVGLNWADMQPLEEWLAAR